MYMYMTTGTRDFMEKIQEKHANEGMVLMHGSGHSLLLHETEGKSVFQTPRRFEVIGSTGHLRDEGFFTFNNISVTDEGRPVFEHRYSIMDDNLAKQPGFLAFRLLRPLDSDTFIVLTEWEQPTDFDRWKNSAAYAASSHSANLTQFSDNTTHMFSSAPYVTTYVAKPEETV
ncbi:antibiotic biosynthesis monooxygenase [Sporosarcina oncorhynchi]|uniref:Antibiotic biosynthesis monooxygenase n=1 Tax=Sporosarcina oncorhynchi TaxID=3056444 RepID=A0ABZ0L6Y7_9BACL|nr:antibiotic biosynthesis monooxygenase [Sporosarcina sp. T2O-4]WOV88326.1 antibiotic biosynthesis monooxygenase [Sporosarcina sp. T2O-4]